MLDGAAGSYRVEFDDQTLLSERLDYKLQKNRACYFDISADRTRLNKKVLISDDYEKTLQEQISQYWGKHTFLSILMYEQSDKAKSFFDSSLSPAFRALLTAFRQISTNERSLSVNADTQLYLPDNDYFFTNLTEGTIQNTQKKDLLAVEKILNRFIKSIYPDVNKAYYKLAERDGSQTDYRLLLNKRIGKNSIGISFTKESTGTRRLLDTLPYLLAASVGGCVVMDEFGNGIHDKLLVSLIQSFSEIIEGQLILMTNNTSLLESSVVPADSFYFIENDADFHKSIKCISDIETRLYKNYDYRNLYIKNSRYKTSSPSSMPDEAAILAMKTLCAGKTS
jgi:AAA15 family ATPase/GTPase